MRVSASPDSTALLDVDFVAADPPWRTGCRWLGGARREAWVSKDPVVASETSLLERSSGPWRVRALSCPLPASVDPCPATQALYARLLAATRGSEHPFLIRIWNFLGAINAGEGDDERYRRFCVGRDAAVDAMFRDPPPAATAIGATECDVPLSVVALCSRQPAIALENPRQTPAWRYPRDYGPVAPGFSRGAVLRDDADALLLASGTASIVGHISHHAGDVLAQLDESLRNLEVLLEAGRATCGEDFRLAGCTALRVYLRDPASLDSVRARLAASGIPADVVAFLHGEVCRRELDIEIEGVFRP